MQQLARFLNKYLIYLILLVSLLGLIYRLDKPFIGHHDWNGAFWGTITRNYVFQVQKSLSLNPPIDGVNQGAPVYYIDYPPLMPILLTLSATFWGVNEISLRLVTVFFSLILIFTIYKIGELLYSKEVGLLAAIFATLTPMFLYFGKLPDHEPIVTSLTTVTIYFYLKQKAGSQKYYLAFLLFLSLALLESWAPYFLLPLLVIDRYFSTKKGRPLLLSLVLIPTAVIIGHLFLVFDVHGAGGLKLFFASGISRITESTSKSIVTFTNIQFITTLARFSVIYFTRILLIITLIWCVRFSWSMTKHQTKDSDNKLWLFLLPSLGFMLIFRRLVFIHDYKLYLLLPFIALTTAITTMQIVYKLKRIIKSRSYMLSQVLPIIILIGVIIFAATERLPYLKTLLATSFNSPGVTLGHLIVESTEPTASIFVGSGEFMSFYDVFVRFYGNRRITGGDITFADYQKHRGDFSDYNYFVLIEDRPTDPLLAAFLHENYKSNSQGKFKLFKLR